MDCRKINEIHYLRNFEAADAVKSYRAPLWSENYKALGAMTLGVFFAASGIGWAVSSKEQRIFEVIKNISVYKKLNISPEGIEALSIVVPFCIGLISAVSALVFQINKDDQIYHWENQATMLLDRIDSHIMLNKEQVAKLLRGAPLEYRTALSKYTILGQSDVEKTNNVEKAVLDKLFNVITLKAHMNLAKAYDVVFSHCKVFVDDQRVIEAFLKARLSEETIKPIKLFAEHSKLERLKLACCEYLSNH